MAATRTPVALRDPEFRGLWTAQTLSRVGDQLARVALIVLVFQSTGSAAAASAAYAVTMVPWLIGGPLLGWLGDRYPRRAVMISCDLASAGLIAAMAVPGQPLPALYVLLFAATLLAGPFGAARSALVRDVFPDDDRYAAATALTSVTGQFAQVAGFAGGGLLAGLTTPRQALLLDAATFVVSAILVRLTVTRRPAPRGPAGAALPSRAMTAGVRLVFGDSRLRRLTSYAWLASLHTVPAGVVAPYVADLGGGSAGVGLLLASVAFGTALSMIVVSRWVPAERRLRLMEPLALLAGAPLVLCAFHPGLVLTAAIWALAGAGSGYQLAANVAFVRAVPDAHRAQAFGVVAAGLVAGQGFGVLAAGALASVLAPALVVAVAGTLAALLALLLWANAEPDRRPRRPSRDDVRASRVR
ncbi:MFS transporter [Cryptosporangium sp. NPDC051539]|uniref:MFS transporter n=1 Tax=Cryptosporangium sp. NPDC051539 TaxID=3363962 RepID=UPI0037B7C77F